MQKKVINVFNKKYFLIGVDNDGKKVYLQDFSWDCGWYFGGGYLQSFTNNNRPEQSKDIDSHTHVDSLPKDYNTNLYDAMKKHFSVLVLSDNELWQFCDWFKVFYSLRDCAEVMKHGGHYTTTNWIKKPEYSDKLNQMIENEVIPAIRRLLTPIEK